MDETCTVSTLFGIGPDNVKGDGVYSCFAPLSGLYNQGNTGEVAVRVSSVRPVSRSAAASAIKVVSLGNYNPNKDNIPPATVTDLRAVPDLVDMNIELLWTAVGDDQYQGNGQ